MEIIVHRINNIKQLKKIPINFGIEIDIRSHKSKLILNHEPYKSGDSLDSFLKNYNRFKQLKIQEENKINFKVKAHIMKFKQSLEIFCKSQ